ncbi:MAG TPA: DNA polymerase I [Tenuifilaceae bacterium]|nr:DNA polymerase I [Tenuifilaceae bacterium]
MKNRLLLLDAYALIYRAYYAFINRPMRNSKGLNTSAIYGFIRATLDAIKKFEPTHVAVAFDVSGYTFRNELYPDYKAQREETPEDIKLSVPLIKETLRAMNIPTVELQGYEADDVIGSIAMQADPNNFEVIMMTPDKDYGQLLQKNVIMAKPGRSGNEMIIVTADEFCKSYDIQDPKQFADILALWGDASDNIKGVNKIGEKTAAKLISQYGSIDNILHNIDQLSGALKKNIDESRDLLALNRKLVKIKTDLDLKLNIDNDLARKEPDTSKLIKIFEDLEFRSLIKEFSPQPKESSKQYVQGSLFDTPIQTEPQQHNLQTINDLNINYNAVTSADEIKLLIETLGSVKEFAFDTETTGLDPISAEIVGLSFATEPQKAWWVPLPVNQIEAKNILNAFAPLFANQSIAKVGQNVKFDMQVLLNYGITVKGEIWDTMIMHYLLLPDSRHNLDLLAEIYLGYKTIHIDELIGKKGAKQKNMRDVPLEQITRYACEDADIAYRIKIELLPKLEKEKLTNLYSSLEEPLIGVLTSMERNGVTIDVSTLNDYAKILRKQIIELEDEVRKMAGVPDLNISSPKQLGEVLFEKLKITSDAKLTKTKQYSTSEEELTKYIDKHPIVGKILEFRSAKKLLSTYVEALPALVNPKTRKIHTSFNQAIASTGRLSSNNPNLQNIPIRDENGREIRKAFIPSAEGWVLLSADYSQIELRLMAHMSGDPNMLQAFNHGEDIHAATAAKIFKVPLSEVTREQRSRAKTANFGMIYGISAFGLSQRLGISRTEAKDLIDQYFSTYSGVKKYMDDCVHLARERGWVETLFGRKRYLPDINSRNQVVRGLAERNAINAPIQGSAADIIKKAMIDIHQELQNKGLKAKMIIQVHDELIFDTPSNEVEQLQAIVKSCMENAVKLDVPLIVDMGVGNNWLEAH